MARPYKTNSKQTPELEARILKCICDGMSLHSICKLDGIPPRETIHRWIKRDADFLGDMTRLERKEVPAMGKR